MTDPTRPAANSELRTTSQSQEDRRTHGHEKVAVEAFRQAKLCSVGASVWLGKGSAEKIIDKQKLLGTVD